MPNSKSKPKPARGERLQIMLSPKELEVVDDFRFKTRMPSRAAAVRELFRLGIASTGLVQATDGKKSADFGVLSDGDSQRPNSNV
jgi:hypothetical protein